MAFCTNCGKEIPEGMNFCSDCGAPLDPSMKPAPETKKKKRWLIPVIIAAAVLVIAAALLFFLTKNVTLPEESKTIVPISESSEETSETKVSVDIDTLLVSYEDIVDDIIKQCDSASAETKEKNCGNIWDYDFDGVPEMVLLYSPDNVDLKALVARYDGNPKSPTTLEITLCELNEETDGTIVSGTYGETPVLNLFYTEWVDSIQIGHDEMISLADGALDSFAVLDWEADTSGTILSCSVTEPDGNESDSEELFFEYYDYNSFAYQEAQFCDTESGIALAEMFTEESLAKYEW